MRSESASVRRLLIGCLVRAMALGLFRLIGLVALTGLAAVGCGQSDGLTRVAVRGKVEWQGEPLAAGVVSFLPDQGHSAPAVIADIVRGEYRFSDSDGPVAGAYQVVVMLAPEGRKTMLDAAGKPAPPAEDAAAARPLPGRWEFRVTVPSQRSFQYDLRLP